MQVNLNISWMQVQYFLKELRSDLSQPRFTARIPNIISLFYEINLIRFRLVSFVYIVSYVNIELNETTTTTTKAC